MLSGIGIGFLIGLSIGIVLGILIIEAVEHALDGDWEIW